MADVPLYVALITAGAGIVGAAIPQAGILLNEFRRAERDRRDKSDAEARSACIDLLRTASTLSVNVENMRSYRGTPDGLRRRLEDVRMSLADTQLHAASVGILAPSLLTGSAEQVAEAASQLVEAVEACIYIDRPVMVGKPETGPLNQRIAAFRAEAVHYTKVNVATDPVLSRWRAAALLHGRRAGARDRSRQPRV